MTACPPTALADPAHDAAPAALMRSLELANRAMTKELKLVSSAIQQAATTQDTERPTSRQLALATAWLSLAHRLTHMAAFLFGNYMEGGQHAALLSPTVSAFVRSCPGVIMSTLECSRVVADAPVWAVHAAQLTGGFGLEELPIHDAASHTASLAAQELARFLHGSTSSRSSATSSATISRSSGELHLTTLFQPDELRQLVQVFSTQLALATAAMHKKDKGQASWPLPCVSELNGTASISSSSTAATNSSCSSGSSSARGAKGSTARHGCQEPRPGIGVTVPAYHNGLLRVLPAGQLLLKVCLQIPGVLVLVAHQ